MSFGLTDIHISKIQKVFQKYPQIDRAVIYGSRAKGNYKPGSDIDLTLFGDKLTDKILGDIFFELDDLLLPYTIDLSIFENIDNAKLREHIERAGLVFFERGAKFEVDKLPAGWEMKKLGEICSFQNGFAFKSKTYKETGLPILRITNIQNQSLELNDLVYFDSKDYKENFDRFRILKDDLVVAMSGATTGKLGINTTDIVLYLNQRVGKFIPKKELLKQYLYYYLSTKVEDSLRIAAGAAQPNLSTEQINNFKIPLPPLPEQQHIVAILDKTFAAIAQAKANAELNLKNAKELFESYLEGMFANRGEGWEVKKLDEICEFHNGQAHEKYIDEDGKYILVNSKFISSDGKKGKKTNSALSPLFSGDIAFVMSDVPNGKALGKCFLVDKNNTYTLNQRIGVIRSKVFKNEFLVYQFNRNKYLLSFNNGENQTNLRKNDVLNYPLFLPPLPEQQRIVQKLDALSTQTKKLESLYQQKIKDLEELKKTLLQKAFRGELSTTKEIS